MLDTVHDTRACAGIGAYSGWVTMMSDGFDHATARDPGMDGECARDGRAGATGWTMLTAIIGLWTPARGRSEVMA
jgi:hypothetical protein